MFICLFVANESVILIKKLWVLIFQGSFMSNLGWIYLLSFGCETPYPKTLMKMMYIHFRTSTNIEFWLILSPNRADCKTINYNRYGLSVIDPFRALGISINLTYMQKLMIVNLPCSR